MLLVDGCVESAQALIDACGELYHHDIRRAQTDLANFLDERWKGMRPVAWGDTLREAQFTASIYQGLCGLDTAINQQQEQDNKI